MFLDVLPPLANPSITPVDHTSSENPGGAPLWEDIFEPTIMHQYVTVAKTPTHGVLSSGSWKIRAGKCTTREELITLCHPVMLTPGSLFGTRSADDTTFKVILWPELIDPPVGLFWPASTTFDEFIDSIDKVRPYTSFVEVGKQRTTILKAWFSQVNQDWKPMAVTMLDASPILNCFPTSADHAGTNLVTLAALQPFQFQLDRFLWAIHCDRILQSPTQGSPIDREALRQFLTNGGQCYPAGLCHSKASPTRQAFFGYLFKPEVRWPDADLTAHFHRLDPDWEVPTEICKFDPVEIVIMPGRPFTPARMRPTSPSVSTTTDWSAYLAILPPPVPIAIPGPTAGMPPAQVAGQSVTPSPQVVPLTLRQRLLSCVPPPSIVAPQPVYDVDNEGGPCGT